MKKKDLKVICFVMTPLIIVLWLLSSLCYGIGNATIGLLIALASTAVLVFYLWKATDYWDKNIKDKEE